MPTPTRNQADELSSSPQTERSTNQSNRISRWAWFVSLVVNVLILAVLRVVYISHDRFQPGSDEVPSVPEDNSASKTALESPAPEFPPQVQPLPGEKTTDTVLRTLEEQVALVADRSEEENIAELDRQTDRLDKFSSDATVEQLIPRFQKWVGTQQRAEEPDPTTPVLNPQNVTGENFDTETAQIHDVLKSETPDGKLSYESVLIDAQGRTLAMPISDEEGEKMYSLMQKIKKNPLLEKVYKKIIMPMLDKKLKQPPVPNPSPQTDATE